MKNGFGSGGYKFDGDDEEEFSREYDYYDDYYDDYDEYDDEYDDYDDSYDDEYDTNGHSTNRYDTEKYDDYHDDRSAKRSRQSRVEEAPAELDDDFDDDEERSVYDQFTVSPTKSDYGEGEVNYDDFEDRSLYGGEKRSQSAARNVIPDRKPEKRRRETQSERYDRYAEDLKKKKKQMGAPAGTTGDFYDYSFDDENDPYGDDDDYYGSDYGPADRTPEPIPPIYAKYLGYGSGGYQGGAFDDQYGKTGKKNSSVTLAGYRAQKFMKFGGIAAAIMLVVGAIVYYFAAVRIYNPVEVENSIVSIQTSDVTEMLQSVVGDVFSDKTIYMSVNGETFTINLGEYDFNYSSSSSGTTSSITVTDDEGNEETQTIVTYENICYNQTLFEELLDGIAEKYGTVMVKPSYTIEDDQLIIKAGTDGVGIDEDTLIGEIYERIKSSNYEEVLQEEMAITKAPSVDIDQIYSEVVCEVQDASSYVDSNGDTIYTEDVVGKKFDLESARALIESGGNSWSITLELTQPEVTLVELKAPTCPDLLAETTTEFSTSNKTRSSNIQNAANRINTYGTFTDGYILQPGEIFSFNDTVGERTEANGFSMATVYTTSGTTTDVGGGICQVSSTIFSAVFKADLEIVSRTNHYYIVHYWNTKGEDATVNWGTIDFKFQNSKTYPIKIKLIVTDDGTITCQVYGTDDGYTAEFDNQVISMTLCGKVYKTATSSKPAGTIEYGDPGYVVEIYKVRYYNGVKVSRELMYTSTYVPLDTVVYQ